MDEVRVVECTASSGAVPGLRLKVSVRAPAWQGYRGLPLDWAVEVVLSRGAWTAKQRRGSADESLVLAARVRRHCGPLGTASRETLEVEVGVDHRVLDRIERFRGGGSIFVRVEGDCIELRGRYQDEPYAQLLRQVEPGGPSAVTEFWSESLELSHASWARILAVLRPPGLRVLEVWLPSGETSNETARRALDRIARAQEEFDHGRYPKVAEEIYKAVEFLQELSGELEPRYGSELASAIKKRAGGITYVANNERHARGELDRVDRPLAQHLLASAKSLVAVYLPSASSKAGQ